MVYGSPETGAVVKSHLYRNANTGITLESVCVIEGPGWARVDTEEGSAGAEEEASPRSSKVAKKAAK